RGTKACAECPASGTPRRARARPQPALSTSPAQYLASGLLAQPRSPKGIGGIVEGFPSHHTTLPQREEVPDTLLERNSTAPPGSACERYRRNLVTCGTDLFRDEADIGKRLEQLPCRVPEPWISVKVARGVNECAHLAQVDLGV